MEIDIFLLLSFVSDFGYTIETEPDNDSGNFIVRVNIASEGTEYVFFHSKSKSLVRATFPLPEHFVEKMEEYFDEYYESEFFKRLVNLKK